MSKKESLIYMMVSFLIAFLLLGVWGMAFGSEVTGQMIPVSVEIPTIPETIDEFVELRDEIAVTPEGGAAMFILALMVYSEDYDTGLLCITASLVNDSSLLRNVVPYGYKGMEPISELQDRFTVLQRKPWIADSYAAEALPENNYELEAPFKIKFYITDQAVDGNINKVSLSALNNGDEDFRDTVVEVNANNIWKVWGWENLILDVAEPSGPRVDDL